MIDSKVDLLMNGIMSIDSSNKKSLEDYIYFEYGYVRPDGQSMREFLKYVNSAVNEKEVPLDWAGNKIKKSLIGKSHNTKKVERDLQSVTNEFYGINREPVDVFEGKITSLPANGMQIGEPDNSGVIIINEGLEHNFISDVHNLGTDIFLYNNGDKIRNRVDHKIAKHLGNSLGFSTEAKIFKNWLSDVFRNYDYILAHEGAHNIHSNNRPTDTNIAVDFVKDKLNVLYSLIPMTRHINKFDLIKHSVDTESLAFKLSTDSYVKKTFDELRSNSEFSEFENLDKLESKFYKMSSIFSKTIIKKSYLQSKKLSGIVSTGIKLAVSYGLYNYFHQEGVHGFGSAMAQGISYWQGFRFCYIGADSFVKIPLYHYFRHKTDQYVDAWDSIIKHHGIKDGLRATVNMAADERVSYAKNL